MVKSERTALMSVSYSTGIAGEEAAMTANWQSETDLRGEHIARPLLAVLSEAGSLTACLQAGAGDAFSVQVLRQQSCRLAEFPDHALPASDDQGLLREVYLCCGGRAAVFAQTLVPATTLAAHPWLGELGEQPLGRRLFARDDVVRQPFEYARLDAGNRLARTALAGLGGAPRGDDKLWARRSLFLVGDNPVSVNEVFFQAILTCLA